MASVAIRDVRKSFGPTAVIHGVDISITDGEFVVLDDLVQPLSERRSEDRANIDGGANGYRSYFAFGCRKKRGDRQYSKVADSSDGSPILQSLC